MTFLKKNLTYVKHHTWYMIRSMDPQAQTEKNVILRHLLVSILTEDPVSNMWTLTYLRHYGKMLPNDV